MVAPAVCVGLILLKVGLACSGIPVPIPIPNFKDLGALDFIDNVLTHVGSLDDCKRSCIVMILLDDVCFSPFCSGFQDLQCCRFGG